MSFSRLPSSITRLTAPSGTAGGLVGVLPPGRLLVLRVTFLGGADGVYGVTELTFNPGTSTRLQSRTASPTLHTLSSWVSVWSGGRVAARESGSTVMSGSPEQA